MITHSLLCGLAHLEATMSPRADWPLFASVLCVTVPKGSVHDPRLLVKGQFGGSAVWGVSEQVPRATVKAERAYIRSGAVGCFVACLTASKGHIPFSV
jgi:hypothetical protein